VPLLFYGRFLAGNMILCPQRIPRSVRSAPGDVGKRIRKMWALLDRIERLLDDCNYWEDAAKIKLPPRLAKLEKLHLKMLADWRAEQRKS
jgi:hypothetical protein